MCTGLEIAAMIAGPVLSAAGGAISQGEADANNERMAEARNSKLRDTLAMNDKLAKQSRDTFNARQKMASGNAIEQQRADETQQRSTQLESAVETSPTTGAEASLSGSAPTVVKSDLAKKMAEAVGYGKSQAQKLAQLGGYGDTWLGQGFKDVEAGRNISVDANFASGNMAILPYQQDFAEMGAYKPISPMGGLLSGLGSMMGSYGGGGGGGFMKGGVPKKTSYTSQPWIR